MVVTTDLDGLDLRVGPTRELTPEEEEEFQRIIEERRRGVDVKKQAEMVRRLLEESTAIQARRAAGLASAASHGDADPGAFLFGKMRLPFGALLEELRESEALVEFRRDGTDAGDLRGFVLAFSRELVLIGRVGDHGRRDGYSIINREDLTSLRWDTEALRVGARAAGAPDPDDPAPRTLDLVDWPGAIRTVRLLVGLATFRRERIDPATRDLARDLRIAGPLLVGVRVTGEGAEDGRFAIRISDITRIDFGGRDEQKLGRITTSSRVESGRPS